MAEPAARHSNTDGPHPSKRSRPIRVLTPHVVPMPADDYEQAVSALAAMIAAWWHDHRPNLDH
jgi:hypothetical protein